jgi:ribosomal protein L7/L12
MKERRDKELARSNNTLQTWVRIRNLIDRNITRSPDERLSDALEKEFKPKDVYLTSYPRDKKIACIKLIREILGLGLKDAKDLSESIPNALLSQNVDAAHRDALFVMFEEIGATIEAREIGKHPIADLVEIPQSDDWVQRCGYDPYNPNVG